MPVAVVQCSSERPPGLREALIAQSLRLVGAEKALHAVYLLEDIGLTDFPLNPTGKVMRLELVEAIISHTKRVSS